MRNAIIGDLVGGAVSGIANNAVKNVTYDVITDVQISERPTAKNQGHWIIHQTRIVSTANKVGLSFNEAEPVLKTQLANAITAIF